MKNLFYITALLIILSGCKKDKTDLYSVVYEVEFISTWSAATHPTDFPNNAHFSPFLTFSHLNYVQLFNVGLNASEGIQLMAETGTLDKLEQEVNSLLNGSLALDKAKGNQFNSPGNSNKVQLGVREGYHTVTAVSMIAPSPDWFVATQTSLIDPKDGMWYDEVISHVVSYDAGTDEGLTFISLDSVTSPQETLTIINNGPLTEGSDTVVNMGYFRFIKIQD